MKKILALLLATLMVCSIMLAACKPATGDPDDTKAPGQDENKPFDYDAISDNMTSADGKYQIAFVTDVGSLKDKSFNQGTFEGMKRYASENEKSYKYYQPANGNEATDDDRYDAMKAAVDAGAEIVICAGFMQGTALAKAAEEFKDVKFVFIDGWVLNDAAGAALANVSAIDFQEEQSGYLAGYAAVMEGFTKLGFTGGGGGTNPACCRFGYGYVQGAAAAAKEKNVDISINYSWLYGASFSPSNDLQTMLNGWYESGTEVIFCCGGNMAQSAFAAASANQASIIGVDVDQSGASDTVVTSATKGLRESVMFALDKLYTDKWADISGVQTTLGAAADAVGLPTDTWSFENYSLEQYNTLFASMKAGTVTVDKDYEKLATTTYERVTLNIVE